MIQPLVVAAAIAAVAMTSTVNQATANTVWVFPYKGAPYAVPHDHGKQVNTPVKTKKVVRQKARDRIAANEAIVIAHHKPGYHDGLPRTPRSEQPEVLSRATA